MHHGRRRFIASMLVLPLTLYGVFVLSPYAQAFYLSLTDWRGFSAQANFVGLDNFARLFDDELFWRALRNNGILLAVVPALTVALGLFIAALLNFGGKRRSGGFAHAGGANFYKVVTFFPLLLSVSIVGVLWQFVYTPNNGLLNGVLDAVGLDGLERSWLADPATALPAVIVVMIWSSLGFYVVLFSAAMQSVPSDVLEAAALDGAGQVATFWRVTLPLVWDSVQVALVYLGVAALDGFALIQIMTVGPGGPDGATEVLALSLWRNAFSYGRFSYATAMGVTLFFLTMTLALLTFRVSRRERIEL
ncbi:carbohydrate ABC transporter permease [Phytohabitans rumicis]|uniref:Sugar ABC transporter permease n=1 Tax=Phytohabitans rumicis TaxID=1076125 RepID=A0A6V8LGK1_9ACTN|nr:sugar ABC transporter permease [Phytohabitans rumicis]GFJ94018.1 sugar ABC transporter permease [Phytohabitans rumicis]